MYINEAIRRCDTLAPNEYTLDEKYTWCDELSAMLCSEYLKKYKRVILEPDDKGEYLLPEGVTFDTVDRITAQGREIEKYDFRSFGIRYLYGPRSRFIVPEHCGRIGKVEVVYLARHEPIRTAKLIIDNPAVGEDYIIITGHDFRAGDSVSVILTTEDDEKIELELPVMEIEENLSDYTLHDTETAAADEYMMIFPEDTFIGYPAPRDFKQCVLERIVDDETVCASPYDLMYIDYLSAQIAYGQRNYTVYNQHMNVFNQRLRAYQNWLMERRTQNKDNKMRNWW